jgi:hypothetical protein
MLLFNVSFILQQHIIFKNFTIREMTMHDQVIINDLLSTIIPKIANGVSKKTIKLKSMGITNAEDLHLRRLRKTWDMENHDLIFVALKFLQESIRSHLIDHLKDSVTVITYQTISELKSDLEDSVIPKRVGDQANAYLFCLNLSCGLEGRGIFDYLQVIFDDPVVKCLQTSEGKEAINLFVNSAL